MPAQMQDRRVVEIPTIRVEMARLALLAVMLLPAAIKTQPAI
jgi:hypothetical protein